MLTTSAFFLIAVALMPAIIADSLWTLFRRRLRARLQLHTVVVEHFATRPADVNATY